MQLGGEEGSESMWPVAIAGTLATPSTAHLGGEELWLESVR